MRKIAPVPLFLVAVCLFATTALASQRSKILVVMSYAPNFPWTAEIREGIDQTLKAEADLTYFHMNTKMDPAGGPAMARKAFDLYKRLKPDGVIAADDDAQALFVVPYLREKVSTPVIFCGVNGDPAQYGYPAANVTGVRERTHLAESVAFAQQLDPRIHNVCYMAKKSATGDALFAEARRLESSLPARSLDFMAPETLRQAVDMARGLRERCDLLFLATLEGVPDENGRPVSEAAAFGQVVAAFDKPTIGTSSYVIPFGVLCAVVKTGQEQGRLAAEQMRQVLAGTPLADIPVASNIQGRRIINVTEMRALGITPSPMVLRGAELTKTD